MIIPAHSGCPGQKPESHETTGVCLCLRACVHAYVGRLILGTM